MSHSNLNDCNLNFARKVKNFYFDKKPITIKELRNIMNYSGDVSIINGIQFVVENQKRKKTPTFMYRFAYKIIDTILGRNPIYKDYQGSRELKREIRFKKNCFFN